MPADWRGTTFNNSNLLGREKFCENLRELILTKVSSNEGNDFEIRHHMRHNTTFPHFENTSLSEITEEELVGIGNAEDYLRVATNLATIYEFFLATIKGYDIRQVCFFFHFHHV